MGPDNDPLVCFWTKLADHIAISFAIDRKALIKKAGPKVRKFHSDVGCDTIQILWITLIAGMQFDGERADMVFESSRVNHRCSNSTSLERQRLRHPPP